MIIKRKYLKDLKEQLDRLDRIEQKLEDLNNKIDKIMENKKKTPGKKDDKNFALWGVPDYQLKYINNILEEDERK
jgi:hypothetical protein